jgi:hypothetical protein
VGDLPNTLDMAEMKLLDSADNKGGLNSGDAIAHETLEAYAMAKDLKLSWNDAHNYAAKNFGEFQFAGSGPDPSTYSPKTNQYSSGEMYYFQVKPDGTRSPTAATVQYTNGFTLGQTHVPQNITKVRVLR